MLRYLNGCRDRGLIPRPIWSGRQDGHRKMLGQVAVAGVQLRVIPARFGDARLQVIRHHGANRAAIEGQRVAVRAQPAGEILTPGRLHIQVPARAQRTSKHGRLPGLARLGIGDGQRIAAEIDEHALASDVLEAHDQVLAATPAAVVDTELGVAQAIRVGLLVLQPQQLQRDVLAALALAVDLQPIRFGTSWLEVYFAAFEQPLVQCKAIQLVWQRPAQANAVGAFDVALNGGRADIETLADLAVAEALRGQAQDFGDLTHG